MFVQVKDSRTGGKDIINKWTRGKQGAQAEPCPVIDALSIIKAVQMAPQDAFPPPDRKKLCERPSLRGKYHVTLWP